LRGGHRGVLEAAIAHLMHLKLVEADGDNLKVVRVDGEVPRRCHPAEQAALDWVARVSDLASGERSMAEAMRDREAMLVERGVLVGPMARWGIYLLAMAPLAAAGTLGMLKLGLGISRGKDVGFLALLLIGLAVLMVFLGTLRPRLSAQGYRQVEKYREEHNALRYAGAGGSLAHLDPRDVMLGVALFGVTPLLGTELAVASRALRPPVSSGSSCGGSSCGSSSCGGSSCGGGGGCGGCGG
jgi:uncharacterized protein (TIGR04222 family)